LETWQPCEVELPNRQSRVGGHMQVNLANWPSKQYSRVRSLLGGGAREEGERRGGIFSNFQDHVPIYVTNELATTVSQNSRYFILENKNIWEFMDSICLWRPTNWKRAVCSCHGFIATTTSKTKHTSTLRWWLVNHGGIGRHITNFYFIKYCSPIY
jgi:hypothetical protein